MYDGVKADGNSKTQNQFESPALVPNDDSMSMSASAAPLKYIGKLTENERISDCYYDDDHQHHHHHHSPNVLINEPPSTTGLKTIMMRCLLLLLPLM
jgi:hypothetical protein